MPFRTAAVFLLFAFGFAANAQCQEEGEEHATFVVNRAALTCTPRTLKGTQPLVLTLGPGHGQHLAISRVSDDTWYYLVDSLPPPPMKSLMSPEAFAAARQLILPADIIGYKWDEETGKGTGERIFSKPGQYIVYTSQHMESEEGGYKCTVNYVR